MWFWIPKKWGSVFNFNFMTCLLTKFDSQRKLTTIFWMSWWTGFLASYAKNRRLTNDEHIDSWCCRMRKKPPDARRSKHDGADAWLLRSDIAFAAAVAGLMLAASVWRRCIMLVRDAPASMSTVCNFLNLYCVPLLHPYSFLFLTTIPTSGFLFSSF